jgi:hypothetical protein
MVYIDSIKGYGSIQDVIDGPHCTYLFLSAKDFLDRSSVTALVLFFISNITVDVRYISSKLLLINTNNAKDPWHMYFPMMLSSWQYFFFRLYPPGVK